MPDYEKMYYHLFNKLEEAIELLQEAHQECEELFIRSEEDEKPKASRDTEAS